MKYNEIIKFDYVNGNGLGIALFVQGCHFHCANCFNSETWDFNSGKEWTEEIEDKFIELANKPHIKRISILGGEPLASENVLDVLKLVGKIRNRYGNTKEIWLYSGYKFDFKDDICGNQSCGFWNDVLLYPIEENQNDLFRKNVINKIDVLVDGRFVDSLKDFTLKFRGSSNQRLIDAKKSIKKGEIVLWQK